jgi:thiol-disulfide isomerase/thioredoxin
MPIPQKINIPRSITLMFLILFTVLGCQQMNTTQPQAEIDWHTLAQGKVEAAENQLPVLVDFYYGPQCPRCLAFDQQIYADAKIIHRLNTQFVAIRIDLRKPLNKEEQALADAMKTGGECMLMFLNSAGEIVKTRQGAAICTMDKLTKEEFSSYLDKALTTLK